MQMSWNRWSAVGNVLYFEWVGAGVNLNTPASTRGNKRRLILGGSGGGRRAAEGTVQSNYRLWGDDFIEVTPDPRASVFQSPVT